MGQLAIADDDAARRMDQEKRDLLARGFERNQQFMILRSAMGILLSPLSLLRYTVGPKSIRNHPRMKLDESLCHLSYVRQIEEECSRDGYSQVIAE